MAVLTPRPQNRVARPSTEQSRATQRPASHRTVWTVGGIAPSNHGVDDGRGHLVRSGTNARIFTASFCSAVARPKEDSAKHQSRIATALGIDRARRILDFDCEPPNPRPTGLRPAVPVDIVSCLPWSHQDLACFQACCNVSHIIQNGLASI